MLKTIALVCGIGLVSSVVCPSAIHAAGPTAQGPRRSHPVGLAVPCLASNMAATLSWQGATGSLLGHLAVMNRGSSTCSVIGRPTILLLANGTDILPVAVTYSTSSFQHFSLRSLAPISLAPKDIAVVPLQWFNWCGARPRTLSMIYALPAGRGGSVLPLSHPTGGPLLITPRCDNAAIPSHMNEGLFQRP